MLGVVFTGASGVGKSTLAAWTSHRLKLPLLPSLTTAVYQDFNTTFDEAFADVNKLGKIQHEIHHRTADRLIWMTSSSEDGFVTDRGPDVLVYTTFMCPNAYPDGMPDTIDTILRRPDVLTVFIRPCESILRKARVTDERRRETFLSDPWVYRVDGAIAYHLETRNIPHITLDGADFRGRCGTVMRAIQAIQWQGWPQDQKNTQSKSKRNKK